MTRKRSAKGSIPSSWKPAAAPRSPWACGWRGAAGDTLTSRRAALAVGLRLAGVDVITPDASQPLERAGGVVAEVNGTPGIHHHYHVADGANATPVAVPILELALQERESRAPTDNERETVA